MPRPFLPTTEEGQIAVLRGICITAGVLFLAYGLYGYLSGQIGVLTGKGTGGPRHVRGDQVELAVLGYVFFSVASFIVAGTPFGKPQRADKTSFRAIFVIGFVVAGLILVSFRTYSD